MTYEFEVYIQGDYEQFEKHYDLFDDGTLSTSAGAMTILFNKQADSLGAAVDEVVKNVQTCGGKILYIDLTPQVMMLQRKSRG